MKGQVILGLVLVLGGCFSFCEAEGLCSMSEEELQGINPSVTRMLAAQNQCKEKVIPGYIAASEKCAVDVYGTTIKTSKDLKKIICPGDEAKNSQFGECIVNDFKARKVEADSNEFNKCSDAKDMCFMNNDQLEGVNKMAKDMLEKKMKCLDNAGPGIKAIQTECNVKVYGSDILNAKDIKKFKCPLDQAKEKQLQNCVTKGIIDKDIQINEAEFKKCDEN